MKLNFKKIKIFILIIAIFFLLVVFISFFLQQPIKNDSQGNEIMNNKILNDTIVDPIKQDETSDQSIFIPGATSSKTTPNETNVLPIKNMNHIVTIKTNMGEIRFATYDEDAPKAVNNFLTLAQKGFYNGTIFHRVINGFMIQGGDPEGTGMGGPGYTFEDELNPQTKSYKEGYKKGVVAMANAGPNTNGSQFFIMTNDYPLPNDYTIFGKVISGQEVIDTIAKTKTGSNDRPISPIIMEKVVVSKFIIN